MVNVNTVECFFCLIQCIDFKRQTFHTVSHGEYSRIMSFIIYQNLFPPLSQSTFPSKEGHPFLMT